jgi:hypothetical protein
MRTASNTRPPSAHSRRPRRSFSIAAFALLLGAAAPLAAQSGTVTVQNNRDEEIIVYVDAIPFERVLGTVEAMSTGTFELPEGAWMGRERVKLLIQPEGKLPLQTEVMVRDEAPQLALVVPDDGEEIRLMSNERVVTVLPEELLEDATLTVRNERGKAADVYLQYGSFDYRLGRVTAGSMHTFAIPDHLVGRRAQLVIVPDEGLALSSSEVALDEGSHLGVTLD